MSGFDLAWFSSPSSEHLCIVDVHGTVYIVNLNVCDSDLLLSKNDGIEVSYNACGVIANLMSDGAAAWTATTPSRYKVLDRMVLAVNSWPLSQKRNINYRWVTAVRLVLLWTPRFHKVVRQQIWGSTSWASAWQWCGKLIGRETFVVVKNCHVDSIIFSHTVLCWPGRLQLLFCYSMFSSL